MNCASEGEIYIWFHKIISCCFDFSEGEEGFSFVHGKVLKCHVDGEIQKVQKRMTFSDWFKDR